MNTTLSRSLLSKSLFIIFSLSLLLFNVSCSSTTPTKQDSSQVTNPSSKSSANTSKLEKPQAVKVEIKRQVQGRDVKLSAQQQKKLTKAVMQSVPENTKINTIVSAIQRPHLPHPTIVVSHLLEGRSHDDTDPRVRGDYDTIPKLKAYAQKRAYEIFKSILNNATTGKVSELLVEINHGVREYYLYYDKKTKSFEETGLYNNRAMTIYSASISFETIPKFKWQHMGLNAFMQNWKEEFDATPHLSIGAE